MGWVDNSDVIFEKNLKEIHKEVELSEKEKIRKNLSNFSRFFSQVSVNETLIFINRNYELMKQLLEYADEENNSLLVAIVERWLREGTPCPKSIISKILEIGADINGQNKNGDTSLVVSIKNENIEYIKYFIEKKAEINTMNSKNETPIELAISSGNIEILNLLLFNGGKIDINNLNEKIINSLISRKKYDFLLHIAKSVGSIPIDEESLLCIIKEKDTKILNSLKKYFVITDKERLNTKILDLIFNGEITSAASLTSFF